MQLMPRNDQVIIERDSAEKLSTGGIVLTEREKPIYGTVLSVGPRVVGVTVGNKVMFGKYSGTDIRFEDRDYTIMRDEDIYAVIGE